MRCHILRPFFFAAVAAAAALNASNHPQILADSNRDGIVDQLDANNKQIWENERGAIFLPNIGDSDNRCPSVDRNGLALSNEELAAYNDASGHLLLNPALAAPLRTSPLEVLSKEATGTISTIPALTLGKVRLFWKQPNFKDDDGSSWRLVDPQFIFNASNLAAGLELAIDSRELVHDLSTWNGTLSVVFEVTNGNTTSVDTVAMKQAPVLFHHHLQPVDRILSLQGNETETPIQAEFIQSLSKAVDGISKELPLTLLNGTDDVWVQDFMEPGYASMPGPEGPVSVRVLVRSAQSTRTAGRQVFELLRGEAIGGHQLPLGSGFGHEEIDSGGNIETIPPYISINGTPYKNGRIIMGKHFDKHPARSMTDFIEAQGQQSVLFLEAGWLVVGHVDEFVQFLPLDNELGFTIAVADTRKSLDLLREAQKDGHGSAKLTSVPNLREPEDFSLYDPRLENMTIDAFLSDNLSIETQAYAQEHIDKNLELLLQEVPLSPEDVLHIPALFTDVTYPWPLDYDGLPPRLHRVPRGEKQLAAMLPSVINGVVVGSDYISAKPWGPVIEGKDIFGEAVVDVYGHANMKVHFVDDFFSHHVNGGEVHCGTNTFRDTRIAWWET